MGYLDGFGVTIKKWLGPGSDSGRRVTLQYPEQTRPKPERFHGRHVLNRYDDGMEKCIGCELCAGVCPAKCIYVRGADNDPDDPTSPGERFGFIYEINYLRCIHCDLCVEACPTEAITETKLFEFAFTNRADAIYTKAELVVDDDGRPQQLPWENWEGGFDPASDASGWMRATAPSGDAEFVGIVAWAGELGYGTRAPEGGGRVEAEVAADLPTPAASAQAEPRDNTSSVDPATRGAFDAPGGPAALPGPVKVATVRARPTPEPATAAPPAAEPPEVVDLSPETTDAAREGVASEQEASGRVHGAFDAPIVPPAPSGRLGRRRRRNAEDELDGVDEPSDADIVAALPDDFGAAADDAAQEEPTVSDVEPEPELDDTTEDQGATAQDTVAPSTGTFDATPLPEEPKRRFGRRGDRS